MHAAPAAALNTPTEANSNGYVSLDFSSPAIVLACLLGCLVLMRLPSILLPYELNVDESQWLSQGMKFAQDPRPWKSVDPTTSGPLNSYPISILLWIGFKPSYPLAHGLAAVLVCLQLLFSYLVFLRLGSRLAALVGAVLIVLFYGNTANPDFLHYSSELFPVLISILAFYCLIVWSENASSHNKANGQFRLLFLAGFLLGTTPWFKLQAGPIGAALGLMGLAASLYLGDRGSRQRVMRAFALCGGALLPTVIMLVVLIGCGSLGDFWTSYILENLIWTGPFDFRQLTYNCVHVVTRSHALLLSSFGLASLLLLLGILRGKIPCISTTSHRWRLATLAAYTIGALFAVSRPAFTFDHYLQFLIFPATCFLVAILATHIADLFPQGLLGSRAQRTHWISIVFLAAFTVFSVRQALHFRRVFGWGPPHGTNERIASVVGGLQKTAPVRSLAIWGWTPSVYVRTGIPPATRDAVAAYVMRKGPFQPYFQKRFLEDLRDSRADLFIDSSTRDAFAWTRDGGYESDSDLKKFIDENYTLVAELSLVKEARPVRFFVKHALAPSSPQASAPLTSVSSN